MKKIAFLVLLISVILNTSHGQEFESLGVTINTEFNELTPIIAPDAKTLFFSRVSHPSNSFGAKGSQDIWYSENFGDMDWSIARRMPNNVNKDQYNIPFSISPDGNTLLVAGAYEKGRYITRGFSTVKRVKSGWSDPQMLKIPKLEDLSKGQFMSGFLANDGKTLIMSFSEKKSSKSDDLYVSFLQKNGLWTKPEYINALNSDATETTPFLASDGMTIYFSSDRKGGSGGNDIWVSKRLDRSWRKWSKPTNLGPKINSEENEYYFSITASSEFAYMVTLKNSIGKGDLYRIRMKAKPQPKQEIAAVGGSIDESDDESGFDNEGKTNVDQKTLTPENVVMIKGKVLDVKTGKPVDARVVYQTLPDGDEVGVANTNPSTGEYTIILPVGKKYSFRAEAPNFLAIGDNVDLRNVTTYTEVENKNLRLVPNEVGATVVLNNIFFQFGKAQLRSESYPELDRVADLMRQNTALVIEISGHTDNIGSDAANLKLSQDRADVVANYLVSKEIPKLRISSKGYGESRPVDTNDTVTGQANNRRVEFVILRK